MVSRVDLLKEHLRSDQEILAVVEAEALEVFLAEEAEAVNVEVVNGIVTPCGRRPLDVGRNHHPADPANPGVVDAMPASSSTRRSQRAAPARRRPKPDHRVWAASTRMRR
jgi:hypothetical protein